MPARPGGAMELFDRAARETFPLSSSEKETTAGVGLTGANVASRATLGLKLLYATVGAASRRKRARPLATDAESWSPDGGVLDGGGGAAGASKVRGGEGGGLLSSTSRVSWASFEELPLLGHRYRYLSRISKGTFADVIRAEDTFRPGRFVAIKVMDLGCGAIGIREVRCMRYLGSVPHSEFRPVVRLLDVLTFRGHCCLVMEHLDGTLHPYTMPAAGRRPANGAAPSKRGPGDGDLSAPRSREQVRRDDRSLPAVRPQARGGIGGSGVDCVAGSEVGCPTHVIRHVALQLVGALLLLHDHGLIHADIKPQSVLVGIEGEAVRGGHAAAPPRLEDFMRGRAGEGFMGTGCSPGRLMLKLWDFGTTIHRSEACQYYNDFDIQTLAFRAPEVLVGCPFGPAIDTWSVGIILLELLLGRPLFHTAGSRAALVQQTLCAFGPLPLRRFRVGRYYSEYFSQDNSLKMALSHAEDDKLAGCCSCCWLGDKALGEAGGRSPCAGFCARRCRLADLRNGVLDGAQATVIGATATNPDRRATAFPRSFGRSITRAAEPERPSWGVAHAHLCRLISAADSEPPAAHGAQPAGGSAGGYGSSSSSTARRNPRLLSFLTGMLCFDPDKRLTPLQALAHPFFAEVLPFAMPLTAAAAGGVPDVNLGPTTSAASIVAWRLGANPATTPIAKQTAAERGCEGEGLQASGKRQGVLLEPGGALALPIAAAGYAKRQDTPGHWCDGVINAAERQAGKAAPRPNGHDSYRDGALAVPGSAVSDDHRSLVPSFTSSASASAPDPAKLDPTPQLQRLAATAEAMVGRGANGSRHQNRGGGEVHSAAVPKTWRRNRYLSGPLVKAVASSGVVSHDRAKPVQSVSAPSGASKEQVMISSRSPSPALAAAAAAAAPGHAHVGATPRRRQRNRFLSPATLAKLNPDLEGRGLSTVAATAVGGEKSAETPTKSPSKRTLIHESPDRNQSGEARKAARTIMDIEEELPQQRNDMCWKEEPATRQRSRRSRTGGSPQVESAPAGGANGVGRTTPARRAAVAAGVALSRLRADDSDSDGSLRL